MMFSPSSLRRYTGVAVLACAVLILFAAVVQAQATPQPLEEAPPYDPADIPPPSDLPVTALGRSIYAENCAPCHGETGLSDGPVVGDMPTPPPALADPAVVWEQTPAFYFHTTKFGRIDKMMPPWGNRLSDDEIWLAVYYAMSLHTNQEQVTTGQELYTASCAACHGDQGAGDGPEAEGDLADLGDGAAMMLQSNADILAGWQAAHADIGADWSAEEQRNVVDYVRTFTVVPPWGSAYRAGKGVVEGQVLQGTEGGGSTAGVPVRLRAFINFRDAASFETVADEEGRFRFENLMTNTAAVYSVEADFDDVRYGSNFFEFGADSQLETADVTVYAAGADASAISTPRANWVIDFEPGALVIGQVYNIGNDSDRAFTGVPMDGVDAPVTYVMPLPDGASNIQLPDGVIGEDYRADAGAVYDTRAVAPGEVARQIFVSYGLPVDGKSVELELPVVNDLANLNLLVATLPNLEVEVEDLSFVETNTIQGAEYELWGGPNIPAGSTVKVRLNGVLTANDIDPRAVAADPAATGGNEAHSTMATAEPIGLGAALALGGALAVAVAGVLVWSTRNSGGAETKRTLAAQKDALLHQIAAVDDQHARGELDDATWAAQRAQLKRQLLVVARTMEEKK